MHKLISITSLISEVVEGGKTGGIFNTGATCFFNASMQCFSSDTQILKNLDKQIEKLKLEIGKLFTEVDSVKKADLETQLRCVQMLQKFITRLHSGINVERQEVMEYLSQLPGIGFNLSTQEQQDAQELIQPYIKALGKPINSISTQTPQNIPVKATQSYEEIFMLSIELSGASIESCVTSFLNSELVDTPGNRLKINYQDKEQEVAFTKQISINQLPETVYIHLKRFESDESGRRKKSDAVTPVNPLVIQTDAGTETLYLNSIVVHRGNLNQGHYVTYRWESNSWRLYDDMSITTHTELPKEVLTGCYVLQYVKNNNLSPAIQHHNASPITSSDEDASFMGMNELNSELDLLQDRLNISQYRSVSDLNLLYQSGKKPDSIVILSDGIFHDLLKAHEESVKEFSGIMTPSAPRTSNLLSAAITLVVGKHPYIKGDPKSKERRSLSFPYFITDGDKPTEYRSVGYATEKRNGREKIYTEDQLRRDYNARLEKGCEVLKLSKPKTLARPEHINHTEQEIYQSFIYNDHFYKDLIAFLDKHKVPRSAKIYAISIDMISDFKMCTHCQQTSIGGLQPTLKGNLMDQFVAIMSGEKKLPDSLGITKPSYSFKAKQGPHSIVRMVWYWEKSGDRKEGIVPHVTTQEIPKNLRGYQSTQILGMHKQEIEIATAGQFAIVTSTHAKSLTGDSGEGTKRRESLSKKRSESRRLSLPFPESPLKK